MTTRHWQVSYGSIPKEIDPDACRSVVELMETAMKRFADLPAMRCAGCRRLAFGLAGAGRGGPMNCP